MAAVTTKTWTPSVVEDLIFRQFLKGEDVSIHTPTTIDSAKLPEFDTSVRALFKYVESGGPAPAVKAGVTPFRNNNNNYNHQQGGASNSSNKHHPHSSTGQAMLAVPPGTPGAGNNNANNNNRGYRSGARDKSVSRTPRNRNDDGMPAPSSCQNNNNGNGGLHDQMKRRRIEWPANIPRDENLKGAQRSALQPLTERRIAAQADVDPDLIFRQETADFPLSAIFAKYPSALKLITQARGLSGDWRNDTFTAEDETTYKAEMKYVSLGPSQAQPAAQPVRLF